MEKERGRGESEVKGQSQGLAAVKAAGGGQTADARAGKEGTF